MRSWDCDEIERLQTTSFLGERTIPCQGIDDEWVHEFTGHKRMNLPAHKLDNLQLRINNVACWRCGVQCLPHLLTQGHFILLLPCLACWYSGKDVQENNNNQEEEEEQCCTHKR